VVPVKPVNSREQAVPVPVQASQAKPVEVEVKPNGLKLSEAESLSGFRSSKNIAQAIMNSKSPLWS